MSVKSSINRLQRRDFLAAGLAFGAGAGALAAGYAAVPDAFARAVYLACRAGAPVDSVLVMIQLAGGNDGLRTVIPLKDPILHDLRPQLAAASVPKAIDLDRRHGLNQNLRRIGRLWEHGKMAIIQGVGYPQPSLSHFESIRVWETGDPSRRQVNGWLGRTMARNYDAQGHPLTGCACGVTSTPGALRDVESTVAVIESRLTFGFRDDNLAATAGAVYHDTPGIYGALFDTSVATVRRGIAELDRVQPRPADSDQPAASYSADPGNELASALKLGAQLILSGTGIRILHVTLDGFDTHSTELSGHDHLMAYLDEAVGGFYDDLARHARSQNVLVATWSEFGRRPEENGGAGTDHGTAAPMLLMGDRVRGGIYGGDPDLQHLDPDGNLKYTVDFRSVYQEILSEHLGADPAEILGGRFEPVHFLRPPALLGRVSEAGRTK